MAHCIQESCTKTSVTTGKVHVCGCACEGCREQVLQDLARSVSEHDEEIRKLRELYEQALRKQ